MEKKKELGYVKVRDFNNVKRLFESGNLYYKLIARPKKETTTDDWHRILLKVKGASFSNILISVLNHYGGTRDLTSPCRKRENVEARYAMYYFLSDFWSVEEIGNIFNRDRTTVISGLNIVKERFKFDKDYVKQLDEIANEIYNPFNL